MQLEKPKPIFRDDPEVAVEAVDPHFVNAPGHHGQVAFCHGLQYAGDYQWGYPPDGVIQ